MKSHHGFTLVEMAVVLVIAGLLLGGVLKWNSVIQSARESDLIATVRDLQTAISSFRAQYNFLPGDFPAATTTISGMVAPACNTNGNGNGAINTPAERNCARDELILTGLMRGTPGAALIVNYSTITITDRAGAVAQGLATVPVNWVNMILLTNINCDLAIRIAQATGDANPQGTTFWASVNTCTSQNATIPVPFAALRIN